MQAGAQEERALEAAVRAAQAPDRPSQLASISDTLTLGWVSEWVPKLSHDRWQALLLLRIDSAFKARM